MNPGSHIGQYRIVKKLGAGGMGTVFLAEHILLGRKAAIKTLLPTLSIHKEIVERFFTEARATSSIVDPGVVQVFDFGYHVDGTAYIVMELLEGEALADRMDRVGAMPQAEALKIVRQIAAALSAAHDRGIIHRDLKPENLYLVPDAEAQGGERVKILDFGICKLTGDHRLTQSGTTVGTPVYMSPEQCRGTGEVDARSDIYALGCVLFHMLTGRPPFECEGAGEYIVAHLQQEAPVATSITPGLHALVDVLLVRCLAKQQSERFQSMQELQEAIGEAMSKISQPGIATSVPRGSPVLGEGFRSGNGTGTKAAITTGQLASGETLPPKRMPTSRRVTLVAVVLGAIITGVFATRAAIGTDETVAASEPAPMPAVQPMTIDADIGTAPAPAVVVEPMPAPVPAVADPVDAPAPLATAVVDSAAGSAASAPTVAKSRPARVVRPARRAVTVNDDTTADAPRRDAAKPKPSEDLYDTR